MADYTFNNTTGQTVARNMMLLFLNTGTNDKPVWSPVGYRVEDSAMELELSKKGFFYPYKLLFSEPKVIVFCLISAIIAIYRFDIKKENHTH